MLTHVCRKFSLKLRSHCLPFAWICVGIFGILGSLDLNLSRVRSSWDAFCMSSVSQRAGCCVTAGETVLLPCPR